MNKAGKISLVAGGILTLGAAVWFGGNAYATKKLGQNLEELRQRVAPKVQLSWGSYQGRIIGAHTVNDVELVYPNGMQVHVDQSVINKAEGKPDLLVFDADFHNFTVTNSSKNLDSMPAPGSRGKLDKLAIDKVHVGVDINENKETADFKFDTSGAMFADVSAELNLSGTKGLLQLLDQVSEKGEKHPEDSLSKADDATFKLASRTQLKNLDVTLHDKGMMTSWNRARYDQASADPKFIYEDINRNCNDFALSIGLDAEKNKDRCEAIANFASTKKDTLHLHLHPEKPYLLLQLFWAGQRAKLQGNAKILEELGLKITN